MKMAKEKKESSSNEKKFPNMSDPSKAAPPVRKKPKKLLRTPSHIIRLCMVWAYVLAIYLLSVPFVTSSLYIRDDLSIGSDLSSATLTYATQEQVDNAADDLDAAIKALKPSGKKTEEYQQTISLPAASFNWNYHIAQGINTKRIAALIEQSKSLDRVAYTPETVKAVNTATLRAQQTLCATVTISQAALQIVLGGTVNNAPDGDVSSVILSGVMIYALVLLPVIGFFISSFGKKGHLKNVYTIIASLACLTIIFVAIYPNIGIGAVLSVFLYILLFCLSAGGIYAKQQEDYIVNHPELEADFTEKHPHFVRALINAKSANLNQKLEQEARIRKAEESAKNKQHKKRKK